MTVSALPRLLWRPVTLAWLPLTALAAMTVVGLIAVAIAAAADFSPSNMDTVGWWSYLGSWWAYTALVGLLVGQVIKELQHCQFAWMLPRLRRRLLPGAAAIGVMMSLFARELAVLVTSLAAAVLLPLTGRAPDPLLAWDRFPAPTFATVAVSFLVFWIGVRPSVANVLGVLLPLIFLAPVVGPVLAANDLSAIVLAAALTAFLIYETFSVRTARARPFIPTKQLSGGSWGRTAPAHGARRRSRLLPGGAETWRHGKLHADDVGRWIRAGWYENQGARGRAGRIALLLVVGMAYGIQIWMIISTMIAAPTLWTAPLAAARGLRPFVVPGSVVATAGSIIIASSVIGIPLAVFLVAYRTIGLRQNQLYPLSRSQRAEIEYWGNLTESVVTCGVLAAVLLGFWLVIDLLDAGRVAGWPTSIGGQHGWILVVTRTLVAVFILLPATQCFRLKIMRGAVRASPVAQLLGVLAIAAVSTIVGANLAMASLRSMWPAPLLLQMATLAALALLSQSVYRRLVEHHFRTADLRAR